MTHESNPNRAPAAPDLADAASAAEYIEKLAADYLRDHASNEPDTGVVVFHTGEAGRDYHSTLVELAEDLRSHVKPAPAVAAPVPASTGREDAFRRALEVYAESYDRMAKMDDGKIGCSDVAFDIRGNMVGAVLRELRNLAARELDADAERPEFPWFQIGGPMSEHERVAREKGFAVSPWKNSLRVQDLNCGEFLSTHHDDLDSAWKEAWEYVVKQTPEATAESAPASAAPGEHEDSQRLDFMTTHEAWIAWGQDGERCRAFHHDEEGDTGPLMGWVPAAWAGSAREAIDKARAFLAPSNSPVGAKEQDK